MENVKVFIIIIITIVAVFSVLTVESVGLNDLTTCNFRAVYNFGDSNSDTGGGSAAFWPAGQPCGETFFGRPVGRGCDGRLIIDFIGKFYLGFLSMHFITSSDQRFELVFLLLFYVCS